MSSPVKRISEWFVKPLRDLSTEAKQPVHFTPFELLCLNVKYSQKGLLFTKPSPLENQDFSINTFLDDLRKSLSATLDHIYPLAARLATRQHENPHSYVIYTDLENSPGAKLIYATVEASVSDIITEDVPKLVHSFFDLSDAIAHDGHTVPLLSIQVTELIDGIFIGGSINHMIGDGTSFWHFMATWSDIFKSKEKYEGFISRPPVLDRTIVNGSEGPINLPYTHHEQFIERFVGPLNFKERFFHFSSASVSKLKAKANSECKTNKISSLQAVIALLWRCITRARGLAKESETSCRIMVSNRRRINPPLSDDYFGNPIHILKGTTKVGDLMANGIGWAAFLLHEAVINHDDAIVKKWVKSWIESPIIIKMSQMKDLNSIHVGSSPRFDMYGCEFGLGKAVAARSGQTNKGDGKITMYPGPEGGGSMDVEVCLLPEYMMNFESDEELISALDQVK
nr:uncharacterized acetyltransferase At3g50280-like [Tanacetum cinerariifolium]